MKNFLRIALIFCFIFSCTEEEITPRNYPRVRTKEASEITSGGVLFRGEITYTSSEITDHGFVWSTNMDKGLAEKVSLGKRTGKGIFEARVTRSLEPEIKYYVWAFVRSEKHIVYGDIQEFVSLGSKAPVVVSVTPAEGTWGDTLVITGENFSNQKSRINVTFNEHAAVVVKSTADSVLAIVPESLAAKPADISLSLLGNISKKEKVFNLYKPVIAGLDPDAAAADTEIRINGDFFSPKHTKVLFGETEVVAKSISTTQIVCTVPAALTSDQIVLTVSTGTGDLSNQTQFTYLKPEITSVNPSQGVFAEEVTIQGQNFSKAHKVYFGAAEAPVTSLTSTKIVCTVPAGLPDGNVPLSISTTSDNLPGQSTFKYLAPHVNDILPEQGTYGDVVTISGNYFPTGTPLDVMLGGQSVEVVAMSSSQIKIIVPNTLNFPDNNISLVFGGGTVTSEAKFHLLPPEILSISHSKIRYDESIVIQVKNFSCERGDVKFNDEVVQVVSCTPEEITVLPPAVNESYDITVQVISSGQSVTATDILKSPWRAITPFPASVEVVKAFNINEGLFVLGYTTGGSRLYQYGENTGWSQLTNPPVDDLTMSSFFSLSSGIYLYDNQSRTFWFYDVGGNDWIQKSDLPVVNLQPVMFATGDRGYFTKGLNFDLDELKEVWEYDASSDTWLQKNDLPSELAAGYSFRSAFEFNDDAYFFGSDGYLIRYDPASDSWQQMQGYDQNSNYLFTIDHYIYYSSPDWNTGGQTITRFDFNTMNWEAGGIAPPNWQPRGEGVSINGEGYVFDRAFDPLGW